MLRLKEDLKKEGIDRFTIRSGTFTTINTNRGSIQLTPENGFLGALPESKIIDSLEGVTAHQFLNEIERQQAERNGVQRITEQIQSPSGVFKIDISPYAQEVLRQNHIYYKNGQISNGKIRIDLSGAGSPNPNSECAIKGWSEFKNFVLADCVEVKVVDGRPVMSPATFKINGDLSVQQIEK